MPKMRFNHMELSFPWGTLTKQFREEVDAFYCDVLGWDALDTEVVCQSCHLLRPDDGQFILLAEGKEPMSSPGYDHLGLLMETPEEVDAVLAECPGVKVAATVGIPHATLGEMVVACIVRDEDAALQESAVLAYAAKRLSSYKVPRRVLFVAESELTLTGSNKVKKGPLRDLAIRYLAER